MDNPVLMNDDLLDLLGNIYMDLKIARLLRIPFAEFTADYEELLMTASLLYVGGGMFEEEPVHQDSGECMGGLGSFAVV
jgi:hypothetical protein